MNMIESIERGYMKEVPAFNVGDTVKVSVKVVEGDKERLQPFEGVVIASAAAEQESLLWSERYLLVLELKGYFRCILQT